MVSSAFFFFFLTLAGVFRGESLLVWYWKLEEGEASGRLS